MLAFASNTWNGWDYIPEVWDAWVVPGDGVVLVATVEPSLHRDEPRDADGAPLAVGQPIAMTRLVMLSEDEAWLEGIRVDPRVRGMGVATDLQVAELRWIAAHGARVVRYMTAATNVGSQRLGAHHGLLEIGRWRTYGRPGAGHAETPARSPIQIEAALSPVSKARADGWPRFRDDPTYAAGHALYEYRPWAYQELTEERFQRHVERDEVLTATAGDAWAAVIVNRLLIADGQLHVALAAGDGEVLLDLLGSLGRPEIRVPDPDPSLLRGLGERFVAAGYLPSDQSVIVVARPVDAAHPLPEPDDPRLLTYGDEPRRICVPPVLPA